MYTYVYIYIYIYAYIYMHTFIYIYRHIMCIYIYTRIYIYIYIYTYTYMYMYTCLYIHVYLHMYIICVYIVDGWVFLLFIVEFQCWSWTFLDSVFLGFKPRESIVWKPSCYVNSLQLKRLNMLHSQLIYCTSSKWWFSIAFASCLP